MAKGDSAKFIADMNAFISKTNKNITEVKRLAVFELFSEVVDRTPIWFTHDSHAGTAKWNWKISIGSLSQSTYTGTDTTGKRTKEAGFTQLSKLTALDDQDIYIENSMPYIFMLEDGGYPDPVKLGSYNTKTKQYEVRSAGGRSTQSPTGMARVPAMIWNTYANEAIRKVGK